MFIRRYNPTTSSSRFLKQINYQNIFLKKKKIRSLCVNIPRTYGCNIYGRRTSYHKGGGCKRLYRIQNTVEFEFGFVDGLEYNPYSSAFLARVYDIKKRRVFYQIAPQYLSRGCRISFNKKKMLTNFVGNTTQIQNMPLGSIIHNVRFRTLYRTAFAKSAGAFAQLVYRTAKSWIVKLPSGELKHVPLASIGTYGIVSNLAHKQRNYGKAGRRRWMNFRPIVRGVAMNPIDHPHGGGQGKTSAGRPSVSPWGKLTKGVKTRKNGPRSRFLVASSNFSLLNKHE